jgi:hypothetical protein
MTTEKYDCNPGKPRYKNEKTGDEVYLPKEAGLVVVDFKKLCAHPEGTYCYFCISHLRQLAEVAERFLDPGSSPHAIEIKKEDGPFPEMLALVNPIAKTAFTMKFDVAYKISWTRTLHPMAGEQVLSSRALMICDCETMTRVADAQYIKGFRMRLKDDVSEADAKHLWESKLSFIIDGERLVDGLPFKDVLSKKEVLLPKAVEGACLFHANLMRNMDEEGLGEVYKDDFIGYMLPKGTHIRIEMENVKNVEGRVGIDAEFDLVNYTTRGFKKSGATKVDHE